MYIVVAGLSDIGKNLAGLLVQEGNEVLVIDRDTAKCAELADVSECMVIAGDASQKAVLEEARVKNSHAFVAAAGDDSENLMLCMVAKEVGAKTVISLVDAEEHEETFEQAGVTLQVNPQMVAAEYVFRLISQPYVKDYLSFERGEIFEIEIAGGMKCVGRSISEIATPDGVKVLVMQRGGKYMDESSKMQPEDWLTLIVNRESTKKGTEFMNRWFSKG
jgi:trk system potassium uptake protein TrkA